MKIVEIINPAEKRRIAADVLADLPEWFGIPESVASYVNESAELSFFAANIYEEYIGFITLKETSPATAELCVMGVKKAHHRRGAGKALVAAFFRKARELGYQYAQVKTLAAGTCQEYDHTRMFYEHMGFLPLEVFPTLWDEGNPCLIMVMKL